MDSSAFCFASDLVFEGMETVLDRLQHRAGLAGVTMATAYHASRDFFPHSPAFRLRSDPGGVFFHPRHRLYPRGLRPVRGEVARERDVLGELADAAGARGLRVHAWTVYLHHDGAAAADPSLCTENAFGDPSLTDLCPANPTVRAYVRALTADVCRYSPASVLAEALHYLPAQHGHHHERCFLELGARTWFLLSLCFCRHCIRRARARGVDAEAVRRTLVDEIEQAVRWGDTAGGLSQEEIEGLAGGQMAGYLQMRTEVVSTLASEAADAAAAGGVSFGFIDVSGGVEGYTTGVATGPPAATTGWRFGIDPMRLTAGCDLVSTTAYARSAQRVAEDLASYLDLLGSPRPLGVVLRPMPPDCHGAANLETKVAVAQALGIPRVDFYHYGLARLEALDWIREAITAGAHSSSRR